MSDGEEIMNGEKTKDLEEKLAEEGFKDTGIKFAGCPIYAKDYERRLVGSNGYEFKYNFDTRYKGKRD